MSTVNNTTSGNESVVFRPSSGYDIPLYGLKNGVFYYIHGLAIGCLVTSLTCALLAIVFSLRQNNVRNFFSNWSKSERFIVYMATCDGLFNLTHLIDHVHITIVRDYVHPKALCAFYGFNLSFFIAAQQLLVNIIAINAFMLMFYNRHLNFGAGDWKLFLWTFGAPLVGATVAVAFEQYGPLGIFCFFDGVKGRLGELFFTTVPLLIILPVNCILYGLTFGKLHVRAKEIQQTLGPKSTTQRATYRAARSMSMFVLAFIAQWWALALHGAWGQISRPVPNIFFYIVPIFTNLGGVFTLIVFIVIRRKPANSTGGCTIPS
ncbi:uncharacterized protein LOC128226127 [Mya arenaria]|uniref:uncharacterized protein LOC128226127 n=1 Tax=Mya arenaria TaxID=6604 RepID=UPI0022E0BDE2|nr:uncharacterized protein LOC128226127 [Mya arenaria]